MGSKARGKSYSPVPTPQKGNLIITVGERPECYGEISVDGRLPTLKFE